MIKIKENITMAEDKKLNPEELENVAGGLGGRTITCPKCGNSFSWDPTLNVYTDPSDPKRYYCSSCGHAW